MEDPSAEVPLDRPSVRDILLWGLEDWVDFAFARQYVSDEIGAVTAEELREQTLTVVSSLLDAGLMVAGDLRATGFTPWPLDPAAAVARLRTEWVDPDVTLHTGDLCWLQITEAGEALARRLKAEP
jgi:hypothetical protein